MKTEKTWAVTGRTIGQHKFTSYGEAWNFLRSFNSRVIEYDGEVTIWNKKDGEWVCYEEVEG